MKTTGHFMDQVTEYFEKLASDWVDDAYDSSDGLSPIGIQRIEQIGNILGRYREDGLNSGSEGHSACDLGCGDGALCRSLADQGYNVTGLDRSESMLSIARQRSEAYGERVEFISSSIESAADTLQQKYDVVTSMGVMYYLENEDDFFVPLRKIIKPDGVALVSCRNRLFNLFFGSRKCKQELTAGDASILLEELYGLDFNLSMKDLLPVLILLNKFSSMNLIEKLPLVEQENRRKLEQVIDTVEGKQHSPNQIKGIVERCGFMVERFYGVQPHFLTATSSDRRARQVMKKLSEALIPLADHPLSLIWCSHFILELRPQ
jgi:ubiquinone biosynthesis O-methyltransferase